MPEKPVKNILIINAHWNNRGDEAAVRAMLDELLKQEDIDIQIQIKVIKLYQFDYSGIYVIPIYPRLRDIPELMLGTFITRKAVRSERGKKFFDALEWADIIVHAPGGPSLGDIYSISEITYLATYISIMSYRKKLFFYAPSMGPFKSKWRNIIRKKIFRYASKIVIREHISKKYLDALLPDNHAVVTLDSAFQSDISNEQNQQKLVGYNELYSYLDTKKKIIGMTITDLTWHPVYSKEEGLAEKINKEIKTIIKELIEEGFRVLLIPQLFGEADDYNYMCRFKSEDCYVMSDQYDTYFQQYIIGKMYVLIGMRYHSNIFSAKMNTPFISISYEQKMKGFVKRLGYEKYCVDIRDMKADLIMQKFHGLEAEYWDVKGLLEEKHLKMKELSHKTTELLLNEIEN